MVRVIPSVTIPRTRLILFFALFFFICCGLGYPSLNRVDWRNARGGLDGVQTYAVATAPPVPDPSDHTQFRVLVPYLAKPSASVAILLFTGVGSESQNVAGNTLEANES